MQRSDRRQPHHTLAVLVTVLALGMTACGGGGEGDAPDATTVTPVPLPEPATEPAPTPTTTPTTPPTTPSSPTTATPSAAAATLQVHLVRDEAGVLWVEPVPITYDPAQVAGAVAREAMSQLLGLTTPPDGLQSLVPAGTQLLDVDLDGTVLTVDLSDAVSDNPGAGAAAEQAFAQQIAHTAAQFPTVESVQVRVEGEVVESLWGHVDWSVPIEPDPFALSPIIVGTASGTASSMSLTGTANVFEAVFLVQTSGPGGTVVDDDFIMASCGTGCRGEWTYELTDLDPGTYAVVLSEEDIGEGEGRPPFSVTVDVEVG